LGHVYFNNQNFMLDWGKSTLTIKKGKSSLGWGRSTSTVKKGKSSLDWGTWLRRVAVTTRSKILPKPVVPGDNRFCKTPCVWRQPV